MIATQAFLFQNFAVIIFSGKENAGKKNYFDEKKERLYLKYRHFKQNDDEMIETGVIVFKLNIYN